jgi:hypothetical protein
VKNWHKRKEKLFMHLPILNALQRLFHHLFAWLVIPIFLFISSALLVCPSIASAHALAGPPGTVAFYRYYNAGNGDHFYTTNFSELGGGGHGYVSEGIAAYVYPNPVNNTTPLYRYYNAGNGDHFYTTNWAEVAGGSHGYVFEGIAAYVYPTPFNNTAPFYRYYNAGNGDHFYTTNFSELGGGRSGYVSEGVAAYVYPA